MPYAAAIAALRLEIQADRARISQKERLLHGLETLQAEKQAGAVGTGVIDSTAIASQGSLPMDGAGLRPGKTLKDAVREAVGIVGNREFSVPMIQDLLPTVGYQLGGKYPRSRLSTTIEDMARSGEVQRVYTGVGSAPHRYKKREVEKG